MAIQRTELASTKIQTLDEPLTGIEGVNNLIFEHLVAERAYNTLRALLTATPDNWH